MCFYKMLLSSLKRNLISFIVNGFSCFWLVRYQSFINRIIRITHVNDVSKIIIT